MGHTSRLFTRSASARSVGFLVAGAGSVAAQHMIPALRDQPPLPGTRDVAGAWIAAIYSHNERRARDFAQRHAIIHFADSLEELLRRPEVQCVYVASHPRHHAETVAAALQAHKHVLCEPPLALTAAEAQPLVQMAQHRGLVLAMNYTWRATGAMHAVHDLLMAEAIGELLGGRIGNTSFLPPERQSWRVQGPASGVLWDRTLHDFDLLHFLLHLGAREVYARATQPAAAATAGPEETVGYAVMTGGRMIQLYDSFVQNHVPVTVELYGTNGSINAVHCGPTNPAAEIRLRRGDTVREITAPAINAFRATAANFLAAVRGAAEPLASGAGELQNLAAVEALARSLREGTAVKV